jgi:hypothetical protein
MGDRAAALPLAEHQDRIVDPDLGVRDASVIGAVDGMRFNVEDRLNEIHCRLCVIDDEVRKGYYSPQA